MRAVLSTTIGRGALSLMAKETSQARPFVKAAHGPATQTRGGGVLSYLWVYGLIVEFAVMTLLSTTIFALFS